MFNWTRKTRVKFKWPGSLNRICTISGMTNAVHLLSIPLSVCFLIVYLQTPTLVIRSCWTSDREFYFSTWEKSLSTITKQFLYTLYFSLQHHPMNFSLLIILISVLLKALSLQEERQSFFKIFFFLCVWSKWGRSWDITSWNQGQKKHGMNMCCTA